MVKKSFTLFGIVLLQAFNLSAQDTLVFEDFDSSALPASWTTTAISGTQAWQFGLDGSNRLGVQNFDGTSHAFFNDDVLGMAALNNTAELVSPTFNTTGFGRTILEFDYVFKDNTIFPSPPDSFKVQVFDGTVWNTVLAVGTDRCGLYACASFPKANLDITAFADTNCQVKFIYDDGDDWSFNAGIDNFLVTSFYNNDLQLLSINSPFSNCGLRTNEPINCSVYNNGALIQDSIPIAFQLHQGLVVYDTIFQALLPGDTLHYTFDSTLNLSAFGSYNLEVFLDLFNDEARSNDSLSTVITNTLGLTTPFIEDFEGATSNFNISPVGSSWEIGNPTSIFLDSSRKRTNFLITGLNGTYLNNDSSGAVTPCFDFSNDTIPPVIEFFMVRLAEDLMEFQYTTDDGRTWKRLESTSKQLSFGDANGFGLWDELLVGRPWQKIGVVGDSLLGKTGVKFRFLFKTDNGFRSYGYGIDNFSIYTPSVNELSLRFFTLANMPQCKKNDSISIDFNVFNWGADTVRNLTLNVILDDSSSFARNVSSSHPPYKSRFYTIRVPRNYAKPQLYNVAAWVSTPLDSFQFNDSLFNLRFSAPLTTPVVKMPYIEDFESIVEPELPIGWTANPKYTGTLGPNTRYAWSSKNGSTLFASTGPDNDNTTGIGNYLYAEASVANRQLPARVTSPCIALDSIDDSYLSFYYHMFGNGIEDFRLEILDEGVWNSNILRLVGSQHFSSFEKYTKATIDLAQYKGKIIQLRFLGKARTIVGFNGDIAIDDIEVKPKSLIQSVYAPDQCGSNNKVPITLDLTNLYLDSLLSDSLVLRLFVNGSLLTTDTALTTVFFGEDYSHIFSDSIDLQSTSSPILIEAFVSYEAFGNTLIDSSEVIEIQNFRNDNYLKEDFESIPIGSELRSPYLTLDSTWILVNEEVNGYQYIPSEDASSRGRQFVQSRYVVNSVTNDARRTVTAILPCINLSQSDSIQLKFDYQVQGDAFTTLYFGEWSNGQITNILDSINGTIIPTAWDSRLIDLSAYAQTNTEFAFFFVGRTPTFTNAVSLDNIQILDQTNLTDIDLADLDLSIQNCDYQNGIVEIEIKNTGGVDISPNTISANYQVSGQAVVNQIVGSPILSGQSLNFSFSNGINTPQSTQSEITAWLDLANDTIATNDTSNALTIANETINDSLFEDFESFTDLQCFDAFGDGLKNGWSAVNGIWTIQDLMGCGNLTNQNSGPKLSNNPSHSKFMYIDPPPRTGFQAQLISPCIDISNNSNPILVFDYHMFGADIDTLFIEVNSNGNWQIADSLIGQKQADGFESWKTDTIDLLSFKVNPLLQIRYRSILRGQDSHIAIDNVELLYSNMSTSISETQKVLANTQLLIYPNPTKDEIRIKLPLELIGSTYLVTDITGKVIQQSIFNDELNQLSLAHLEKGVYFIIMPEKGISEKLILH